MRRLLGAVALLLGEGGLVDEDVRALGDLEHARRGRCVAREDDLPPGPGLAQDLLRPHLAAGHPDGLPRLEAPEVRSGRHAERRCGLDVEPPGPRQLDERVAVRRDPVGDAEHDDAVVTAVEHVPVPELDELEAVREPSEDALERGEQIPEAGRPVDRERHLAAAQRERLQHPREAEIVVGVVMRHEDLAQLHEADV